MELLGFLLAAIAIAFVVAKLIFSRKAQKTPKRDVEWARLMRELGYDGELFLLFEEGRGGLYGQE